MGNRVRKFVDKPSPQFDITTWYVRDASGNVMSTYEKTGSGNIKQIEVPLYGSDRVGMAKRSAERGTFTATDTSSRWLGYKMYELKDHLGNVRVVLGDKKTRTTGTNPFQPEVISYSGYFPFGMQMQEDTWQSPLYRYGYNGKEKDGELHGEGNSYDYGARILDPRAGRWLSLDPLADKYPQVTPYASVGNNPIANVEQDGRFFITDHINADLNSIKKAYAKRIGDAGSINEKMYNLCEQGIIELKAIGNQAKCDVIVSIDLGATVNKIFNFIGVPLYNPDLHLDNLDNKGLMDLVGNGNFSGLNIHTKQDFYSHSNYMELMLKRGFTGENAPLFSELDPESALYKEISPLLRTTNYNGHPGLKTDPYDHDQGATFPDPEHCLSPEPFASKDEDSIDQNLQKIRDNALILNQRETDKHWDSVINGSDKK
ncbi:MAG: RHS repeat-associated core domain-containing protein [Candidatus Kapaibacterium sp.]